MREGMDATKKGSVQGDPSTPLRFVQDDKYKTSFRARHKDKMENPEARCYSAPKDKKETDFYEVR